MKRFISLAALLFLAAVVPAVADEQCTLHRAASLDMGSDMYGRVTVPMTIKDQPVTMLVDTGGYVSLLTEKTVHALGLYADNMPVGRYMEIFGGLRLTKQTIAYDVALGRLKAPSMPFAIVPDGHLDSVDGILSPDILAAYDTEFDFANNKFNLFGKDHCDGEVVYWTKDPYAVVPFTMEGTTHIRIEITVDGKSFHGIVDTGSARSLMSMEAAQDAFGIADNDPNLKPMGNGRFTYPFKALTIEGVAVQNPAFELVPRSVSKVRNVPDIIIGMGILRQLHIYIAYREKNLYVTPASAH